MVTSKERQAQADAGTGAPMKPCTQKQLDMYMKGLPRKLKDYLLYDALADWHPDTIYSMYRKVGADATLEIMKRQDVRLTLKAYGIEHPVVAKYYRD